MAKGVITFYDDLVGLNMTKGDEILLTTVNAVRIPPKSEALIPVSVPKFFKSKISLIEPAANLHYKNLALAKAIVLPKNNTTVCKMLNPTDTHIFLKRRTTVAVIEKLSVDSINVIDNQVTASDDEAETSTVSWRGGLVVGRRTCDLVVAGSSPGRDAAA